jgi:hypothetical protein
MERNTHRNMLGQGRNITVTNEQKNNHTEISTTERGIKMSLPVIFYDQWQQQILTLLPDAHIEDSSNNELTINTGLMINDQGQVVKHKEQ